jgi:hypothetical protein
MTRAPQRRPRRRPIARSIVFSRASSTGGGSSLSITAAALANRRIDGPSGGVARIGETATTPPIVASAAAIPASGLPCRPRRLAPSAIA